MLILPHGTLMQRETLPMSRAQVGWLLSGEAFLRNLDHLKTIRLEPYCAICAYAEQRDEVSATWDAAHDKFVVRSVCRAGEIPLAKVRAMPLEELLAQLGWRLRCPDCPRYNMADGVLGDNDPVSARLTVLCGCTERVFETGDQN